jgi:hypothetical protein
MMGPREKSKICSVGIRPCMSLLRTLRDVNRADDSDRWGTQGDGP